MKIFISHGYFGITLLGLQVTLNRQASTVDVAVTGVRIRNLPQIESATCNNKFLELVRIREGM